MDERKWGMPSIEWKDPALPPASAGESVGANGAAGGAPVAADPPNSETTPSMSTISSGFLAPERVWCSGAFFSSHTGWTGNLPKTGDPPSSLPGSKAASDLPR